MPKFTYVRIPNTLVWIVSDVDNQLGSIVGEDEHWMFLPTQVVIDGNPVTVGYNVARLTEIADQIVALQKEFGMRS